MSLTERQLEYIEYRLKSGDNFRPWDCLQLFPEYEELDKNPAVRLELAKRRLEDNEKEDLYRRKALAQKLLDLENIEKIAPLVYKAVVEILQNPHNKNAPAVIKMILGGKIRYLERFGEIQANKDNEVEVSNDTNSNPQRLAYRIDELEDD